MTTAGRLSPAKLPLLVTWAHMLGMAQAAEAHGFAAVSVEDHHLNPTAVDAWSALSAISAATNTVTVSSIVADLEKAG